MVRRGVKGAWKAWAASSSTSSSGADNDWDAGQGAWKASTASSSTSASSDQWETGSWQTEHWSSEAKRADAGLWEVWPVSHGQWVDYEPDNYASFHLAEQESTVIQDSDASEAKRADAGLWEVWPVSHGQWVDYEPDSYASFHLAEQESTVMKDSDARPTKMLRLTENSHDDKMPDDQALIEAAGFVSLQDDEDYSDRLWAHARVALVDLMHRRMERLDVQLRERPECQLLSFEESREVVELLVPRLLDVLFDKYGDRRGHAALVQRLRASLSAIMTPDGAMRPYITEEQWRREFQTAADRLAGKMPQVHIANRVLDGKITSFKKRTKDGRPEWGQSCVHYKNADGVVVSAIYFVDTAAEELPIDTDIWFVLSVSAKGLHCARDVCRKFP